MRPFNLLLTFIAIWVAAVCMVAQANAQDHGGVDITLPQLELRLKGQPQYQRVQPQAVVPQPVPQVAQVPQVQYQPVQIAPSAVYRYAPFRTWWYNRWASRPVVYLLPVAGR